MAGAAFLFGLAVGIWRTWAFARKVVHLGVSLDAWSDYDEAQRQAKGQSTKADEPAELTGRILVAGGFRGDR